MKYIVTVEWKRVEKDYSGEVRVETLIVNEHPAVWYDKQEQYAYQCSKDKKPHTRYLSILFFAEVPNREYEWIE
jgi:hypothetical protein